MCSFVLFSVVLFISSMARMAHTLTRLHRMGRRPRYKNHEKCSKKSIWKFPIFFSKNPSKNLKISKKFSKHLQISRNCFKVKPQPLPPPTPPPCLKFDRPFTSIEVMGNIRKWKHLCKVGLQSPISKQQA